MGAKGVPFRVLKKEQQPDSSPFNVEQVAEAVRNDDDPIQAANGGDVGLLAKVLQCHGWLSPGATPQERRRVVGTVTNNWSEAREGERQNENTQIKKKNTW